MAVKKEKENPDNDILEIINQVFSDSKTENPDISEIDTAKIVLSILNESKNIKSLSHLNIEQVQKLRNVIVYNKAMKNPLIDTYVANHLQLSRSKSGFYLLNLLKVMSNVESDNKPDSFFGSIKNRIIGENRRY